MGVSVEVVGTKEAVAYLSSKGDRVSTAVGRALREAALFVEGEVKQSIAGRRAEKRSVDTGRLLNSVTSHATDEEGVIETNIPYAEFIEYGTSRLAPRSHFRNSAERNRVKVKSFLDAAVKEATN